MALSTTRPTHAYTWTARFGEMLMPIVTLELDLMRARGSYREAIDAYLAGKDPMLWNDGATESFAYPEFTRIGHSNQSTSH